MSRQKHLTLAMLLFVLGIQVQSSSAANLRCGAAAIDVTPRHLPVIRNGGFLEAQDDKVLDPLHARAIVLDDGTNKVAVVVVDSCMIPTPLCDDAKRLASEATGIASDHIMISATHTHTAPSVMRYCLGSGIDERYAAFLPAKIAEALRVANERLQPAKVGSTQIDASHFTKCRRWITRSDKVQTDPFGEITVHANMHPGHQNPDFIGPSGPIDPWLSLLTIADENDKPIAVLANLSMHYFGGHPGVSADYYGRFCNALAKKLTNSNPDFVGIMSQGTSGDLWWGDYSKPNNQKPFQGIDQFSSELVDLTMKAMEQIEYADEVPVRIAEKRLTLPRRVPNEERLAWARRKNKLRGDRKPKDRPEVYALQAEYLHENPIDEVVLQAIRIGDLGITGIPNEVYALTGLKLKRRCPLSVTMNISLANGATGYIPPPEQHALGGYNTWPATTAGLEVAAEPKIVDTLLSLLEQIAEKPRKAYQEAATQFSQHIAKTKPHAYWRMDEMEQTDGRDVSNNMRSLRASGDVAYHLPGRTDGGFGTPHNSHSIQLAGGKLVSDNLELGESYSVQFSFYVGTPMNFRERTGSLVTRGADKLFITGSASKTPGCLAFNDTVGTTTLETKRWHHCVFVRNGDFVQAFLDGKRKAEFSVRAPRAKQVDAQRALPARSSRSPGNRESEVLMLGGDRANTANLEGKLDEVSVYDRALTNEEIAALFNASGLTAEEASDEYELKSKPLDVKSSMQRIHIRDGFRVELVAAEPLVIDPVAVDWGPDGKLWVAEMADYPMGMDNQGKPGGRIRFLEDTNADGQYDRSTVFLEDVSFPNGVMAWQDGVLVTAAPEIFFAKDSDGDGQADVRKTLFSGFMTGNQQLRVNGLRWGLNGMVHCASGAHHAGFGSGNSIFSTKLNSSIRLGSRDFRFDPETGTLDPQSGPSQYGRVRDDFGNWFGVQNSQPLWHYVLANQYTRRNKEVPPIDPRRQVRVPRMPEVYSAKPPQRRFHGFDHAGHYTSACGISIYRDDVLFPREEIHAFTCAPFHNLVQHHVLTVDGTSFRGERADDGTIDFFASSDRWTRPVMTRTGPDGALWIVDMYRYMIEHPQWLPQEGQDALRPGYRAGDDRGRIYRVVRNDQPARSVPYVEDATTESLATLLAHPNGIVRDLTHQKLQSRKIRSDVLATVRKLAKHGQLAESRIQSLAVLQSHGDADADIIRSALKDEHPAVRRFAIQMAEDRPASELDESGILGLVHDSNPLVRLQMACSLGQWHAEDAGVALAQLASRTDNDEHTIAAIVSSLPAHYASFVDLVASENRPIPGPIFDAMLLMGESRPQQLAKLLRSLLDDDDETSRFTAVSTWLDRLAGRKETLTSQLQHNADLSALVDPFTKLISDARDIAVSSQHQPAVRAAAIGLLGREILDYAEDIERLNGLLTDNEPQEVQLAAIQRLSGIPERSAAKTLLEHWPNYLPSRQAAVAEALLSRTEWRLELLAAIEAGTVRLNDLSLAQQQALRNSRDKAIAKRAANVLGSVRKRDASAVVGRYVANVVVGDFEQGRLIFDANCKVCHPLDKNQKPAGPDLRALTDRSRTTLLTSILDPSQTIEPKYTNYSIVLKNGEVLGGVVTEESENALTLVDSNGKRRKILRSSIDLAQRSEKSMMPEGFETKINARQMSNLLAYLRDL